jgi:hypothetical protein
MMVDLGASICHECHPRLYAEDPSSRLFRR